MRPIKLNIRHLRVFCEVAKYNSASQASDHVFLTQPAITQAIAKLETLLEVQLFDRRSDGMFPTEPGSLFLNRARRALEQIETGARRSYKLRSKAKQRGFSRFDQLVTSAQLRALLGVEKAGNFSLAARLIGVSQPTIHRTARDLERLSGMELFKRNNQGIELTRAAQMLALHARLAFSELDQGLEEVEAWRGLDTGKISIGTMPLARSYILPQAINELTAIYSGIEISVVDGPYDTLLHGLRSGELDLLIGALRDPLPIKDVCQEELFEDTLVIVGRKGHPLSGATNLTPVDLANFPWVVPRIGTPTRTYFENLFENRNTGGPDHIIESSSLMMIRGLLLGSDRLTIISQNQIRHEEEQQLLERLEFDTSYTARPIGLTLRMDWQPTAAQKQMLEILRSVSQSTTLHQAPYSKNE